MLLQIAGTDDAKEKYVDDEGDNKLVESKRGVLYRDATIIDLTNDDGDVEIRECTMTNDIEDEEDDVSI